MKASMLAELSRYGALRHGRVGWLDETLRASGPASFPKWNLHQDAGISFPEP
jgi:hypothetical protein